MSKKIYGLPLATPYNPEKINVDLSEYAKKDELPSSLPNPFALTINGQAYDGSAAVDVTTKLYEVTITDNGDGTYTSDHYYADIKAAYDSGRIPVAAIGAEKFPLIKLNKIAAVGAIFGRPNDEGVYTAITIRTSSVTVKTAQYAMADDVNQTNNLIAIAMADGEGNITSIDKTLAEIVTAINNGQGAVLMDMSIGAYVPVSYAGQDAVVFSSMVQGMFYTVVLESDGSFGASWNYYMPNEYPLIINGQSYNGESEVTVDTGEFVVTVTGTQADGYTADKTYAEARSAYDAGRTVVCLFNGEMFVDFRVPLSMVDALSMMFMASPMSGAYIAIQVSADELMASEMLMEMTIGDQTWQMDESVDFTDTINGMIDTKVDKILSGDSIPDYVRTEAERLAAVVQARQNENTVSAILSSDYHLPQPSHAYYAQILESITHAGQAMSILRSQLSFDFEAKLGDLIWDATETPAEALKSFQVVHSLVSEGNVLDRYEGNGNHDHLQSNGAPLTDAQVYANIGIYNKGCARDDANRAGGYCYRDYDEFVLRVVLLNTSEANDGSFAMSSKQIEWLSEALNVPVEEGWGILILSHHPLDWGGSSTAVMKKIKAASGIIANLHGHVHTFTQDVITGTEIPRLAIPNVCFYRNNEYGQNGGAENSEGIEFGTTTTYNKTPKSATDTSFCVLTLDRATGKLYLDRYGAGIDREETVPTWGKLGYTNLVPTSQAADSTDPYNGVGYKNGVYLSSSGGDGEDETCVATGYIPYTWATDNAIYVKGAEVSSASHVRIYGYSEKGSAPLGSASCSGPSLSTYFTVEELGTNYYKLTPLSSNATGVVYLRLSLIGTGENLIVTVNEPIE